MILKGVANFVTAQMLYTATGAPYEETGGGAVLALVAKDGGVPVSTTNAPFHRGQGFWQLYLESSEMNANHVAVQFFSDGVGAIQVMVQLYTTDPNVLADAVLKRDWTAVTGEASRSVLNALRFLRNKWSISGATLTVTKEDDSTAAYTATLTTDNAAQPVVSSDPT